MTYLQEMINSGRIKALSLHENLQCLQQTGFNALFQKRSILPQSKLTISPLPLPPPLPPQTSYTNLRHSLENFFPPLGNRHLLCGSFLKRPNMSFISDTKCLIPRHHSVHILHRRLGDLFLG